MPHDLDSGNLLRLVGDAERWCAERSRPIRPGMPGCGQGFEEALELELAAILIKDASPAVRERLASHTYDWRSF